MGKRTVDACIVLLAVGLIGCPSDDDTDGGAVDDCATDTDLLGSVGCNGTAAGPQAASQVGGSCVPDPDDDVHYGSCVEEDSWCVWEEEGDTVGICVIECPMVETYISTGGCPQGFRCFLDTTAGEASCYPDCQTDTDCGDGLVCAVEDGTCYPPEA